MRWLWGGLLEYFFSLDLDLRCFTIEVVFWVFEFPLLLIETNSYGGGGCVIIYIIILWMYQIIRKML